MSAWQIAGRITVMLLTHPTTHKIARQIARDATAQLIRHIRSASRNSGKPKTWQHFGGHSSGGSSAPAF